MHFPLSSSYKTLGGVSECPPIGQSKATLKDLRRTLVSIGRVDLTEEQVKKVVGHTKGMDTFGVYGELVDGEMQEVADALDQLFAKYLLEPTEKS
jgi:hypothetical protein